MLEDRHDSISVIETIVYNQVLELLGILLSGLQLNRYKMPEKIPEKYIFKKETLGVFTWREIHRKKILNPRAVL